MEVLIDDVLYLPEQDCFRKAREIVKTRPMWLGPYHDGGPLVIGFSDPDADYDDVAVEVDIAQVFVDEAKLDNGCSEKLYVLADALRKLSDRIARRAQRKAVLEELIRRRDDDEWEESEEQRQRREAEYAEQRAALHRICGVFGVSGPRGAAREADARAEMGEQRRNVGAWPLRLYKADTDATGRMWLEYREDGQTFLCDVSDKDMREAWICGNDTRRTLVERIDAMIADGSVAQVTMVAPGMTATVHAQPKPA